MTKIRTMLLVPLALLVAAGCGEGGPALVKVTGTVTLNGKPLEDAIVQFSPDASNKDGKPAEDRTGPSGNYKIMTKGRSGMVPGKYRVVITKTPQAASAASTHFSDDPFMAQLSATPVGNPKTAKKDKDGPQTIERSFDRDVPPEGGEIDFDLKGTSDDEKAAGAKS